MLCTLLDKRELPASELAYRASVAPNAASAHLAKLVSGGLLKVRTSGRERLFSLAGADVARALEALTVIAPPVRIVALSQSRIAADLQAGRSCYDHLAGRLGVSVTDALVERGIIVPSRESSYRLTRETEQFFASLDVNLEELRAERRHFARQCMDWSERRPHLGGSLGAALRDVFLDREWIKSRPSSRALRITSAGQRWMRAALAIEIIRPGEVCS